MAFLKNISSGPATDTDLVQQYKTSGNLNVLGELYQRYMELVYGVCLKYLKQPESAQDAVIAIFEELTVKLKKHEVDHFRAWLYTLSKNHCLMRLRTDKKQLTVEFDGELMQSTEILHPDNIPDREEEFRKLELCMEQLPEEQKNAVRLFYLEGKCYKEIAALTGLEWNQVRSYIQNGRRNLKICMESNNIKSVVENGTVAKK